MTTTTRSEAATAAAKDGDPILRLHDGSLRSAMQTIAAMVHDGREGFNQLDCQADLVPSAFDAVLANPLSAQAVQALQRLTGELVTLATALHTQVGQMRRLQQHGAQQLQAYETRLAEVRRLDDDGAPPDESTVNGDLAEEL